MTNYGHYGLPAMRAAIATGVAILAHLVIPFGVIQYRGPAAPKPLVLRFFEASDMYSSAPGALGSVGWSSGLLFGGLAVAALGVTILMVLGYQPLTIDLARWFGAVGGFLTVIGAAMALTPSMYHVGTGFSTFMGTLLFTEFRSQYWAVSPVIVAVCMGIAIHHGLQVMTKVAANRDGIRDAALSHAGAVRLGSVFLAAVLLVPWSIGLLPDGVSDSLNFALGDDNAPLFFSAQDVQGATLSELAPAGHLRYARETDWQWTGLGITIMSVTAWAAILVGSLGAFAGTMRSVGMPRGVETAVRVLFVPIGLGWVASALLYLASWIFFAPRSGLDATFLPGFWPVLVPVPAYFLIRKQLEHMRGVSQEEADVAASSL